MSPVLPLVRSTDAPATGILVVGFLAREVASTMRIVDFSNSLPLRSQRESGAPRPTRKPASRAHRLAE